MSDTAKLAAEWQPRVLSILRIIVGLLFMEHGLAKLTGFPPAPPGLQTAFHLMWFAGVIEAVGGFLVAVGLFTRAAAFIMSGEMAIAYFMSHAPRGFYPAANGGDAAILYCFIFFYFFVAGGGAWALDRLRSPETDGRYATG
jgi:putative oxidoreductase